MKLTITTLVIIEGSYIQDIENYFELVHIETQELTSTGFKTAIFENE